MAGIWQRVSDAAAGWLSSSTSSQRTLDNLVNFEAKLGSPVQGSPEYAMNVAGASHYGFSTLSRNRQLLDNAYSGSWLVGVACDAVAEDMCKSGATLKGDLPPEQKDKLYRANADLRIWESLADTIRWARLYGGCIAVLMIDGQDMATPFNINTVRREQFKGLMVLDRWMVWPDLTNLVREFGPHFGKPAWYTLNTNPSNYGMPTPEAQLGQRIHYSRVIRFDGVPLPVFARQANNGWGQSVIARLYDRLIAFDSTTQGVAQLVFKAHLRVLKMKGYRAAMAGIGNQAEGISRSIRYMQRFQSNEGVTAVDSEDDLSIFQYNFAGLPEVMHEMGNQVSGALEIPMVRLMGQSPAGFSTGETDLVMYEEKIGSLRKSDLAGPVLTIFKIQARSVLGRDLPEGMAVEFNPLRELKATDRASVANTTVDAVSKAASDGLIPKRVAVEELRESSKVTGIFGHISDDDVAAAEEEDQNPPEPEGAINGPSSPSERRDSSGGARIYPGLRDLGRPGVEGGVREARNAAE